MCTEKIFLWDDSFPVLQLKGKGTRDFLNGQTTSEILSVREGLIFRTCWLTAIGKLRALLEIRLGVDEAHILILAGNKDHLYQGFADVIFPADKVSLKSIENIRRIQVLNTKDNLSKSNVIWLEDNEQLPNNLKAYETLTNEKFEYWRLRQGVPIGSGELSGETNPFELGLSNLVSLNKGCYLGQETMAKLSRSSGVKQQLRFWQSDKFVSKGQQLFSSVLNKNDKPIGVITSATVDKISGFSFGLALIKKIALTESELFLADTTISVRIAVPFAFVPPPNLIKNIISKK